MESALFSEALSIVVLMVSVLIVPSLLVGLVVAVFQAATQNNEQTLSFLPRLMATMMSIFFFGPWLLAKLIEFSERLVNDLPYLVF